VTLAISMKQLSEDQIIDQSTYLTLINRAFILLTNPVNIWVNGSLKMKRLVFDIVFDEYVTANAEKKYLTPQKSLFYQAIADITDKNSNWWT